MLFEDLSLPEEILQAVKELGYEQATEIQEKTIPLLIDGKDVIGRSHTGTGKTAAFGIPGIMQVDPDNKSVQLLILCPTRELAMQAADEIRKFAKFLTYIHPVAIFGGADIEKQIWSLRRGANIVIGTPGRVIDHLERKTLKLDGVKTVVLDEADEMLNMGFREDIETILAKAPAERQTVLFSATMPPPIMAITKEYQNSPVLVGVEEKSRTVDSVTQYSYEVPFGKKDDALIMLLTALDPKLAIIFCNTKVKVQELSDMLVANGFKAAGLHGDMKQMSRTQVLNSFKHGKINILIATDVAARGIDVEDVDIVFNYDLPQDNEYYIHRIGRTGRAGKKGESHTLISGRRQVYDLRDLARFVKAEITPKTLPTKEEIIEMKVRRLFDRIETAAESGKYDRFMSVFEKLIAERGLSPETIAVVLLGMRLSKDLKHVPDTIKADPYVPKNRRQYSDRPQNGGGRSFGGGRNDRGDRNDRGGGYNKGGYKKSYGGYGGGKSSGYGSDRSNEHRPNRENGYNKGINRG
ncbi:MAG: DEAD/DEAH box helicase [Ruminococcus sp.]|jgi:ATP-dependent RNA helicase DeaD|nr:DEAD/DEAH box helicase [Ruminococcus sp.]